MFKWPKNPHCLEKLTIKTSHYEILNEINEILLNLGRNTTR